jgi:hypothetical protein
MLRPDRPSGQGGSAVATNQPVYRDAQGLCQRFGQFDRWRTLAPFHAGNMTLRRTTEPDKVLLAQARVQPRRSQALANQDGGFSRFVHTREAWTITAVRR